MLANVGQVAVKLNNQSPTQKEYSFCTVSVIVEVYFTAPKSHWILKILEGCSRSENMESYETPKYRSLARTMGEL